MPAIHTRSILFLKNDYWVLRDRVASQGNHQADLWFHFAANVDSRLGRLGGEALVPGENGQNAGVQIVTFGENGRWSREDGWISHSYGDRGPGQVLRFATRISGAGELITFLLPAPVEALSNFSIREIETIGGSAFEIEKDNSVDLVMIRDASRGPLIETARMASDFEWTWARFYRSSNDVPSELLVLGGQRLELEGQEVLKSAARISYLVASRRGDQFHVETDDKVLDLPLTKRNLETAFSTSVSANLSNI
jgi:hypothetical protein